MSEKKGKISVHKAQGSPIQAGNITVVPQSQAVILSWKKGGWVWNRPVGLLVRDGEGERRVPIPDVTRWVQIGFGVISVIYILIGIVASFKKSGGKNHE
jgi:hypothetical protein